MITKEEILKLTWRDTVHLTQKYSLDGLRLLPDNTKEPFKLVSSTWRVNGKCKTWKRSPERFRLPIKHGLYTFGEITEENAHLFTLTKG